MKDYCIIFIHGAWHGAWCWKELLLSLKMRGFRCIAKDLPGHGQDETPLEKVSLEAYITSVEDIIKAEKKPVILVGHSMGGMVASSVAQRHAEKVLKLIYVASVLLQDGESWSQMRDQNKGSAVSKHLLFGPDRKSFRVSPQGIQESFYHLCTPEQVAFAKKNVCWQAKAPLEEKVRLTDGLYGKIPKYYIKCLQDRALLPSFQDFTITQQSCERVYELDTDHSPFFSKTEELASIITEIVNFKK
jgi:pimeloyl-ACP methyl ester carboxylesterase